MTQKRVIVAGLPPMLSGIVRVLAAEQPSLEIVAELDTEADVVKMAGRLEADVVLMPAAVGDPVGEELLLAHPRLRLLLMGDDARTAQLYRLVPHRLRIDDVSPSELFDAMIGAGRYGTEGWPS